MSRRGTQTRKQCASKENRITSGLQAGETTIGMHEDNEGPVGLAKNPRNSVGFGTSATTYKELCLEKMIRSVYVCCDIRHADIPSKTI